MSHALLLLSLLVSGYVVALPFVLRRMYPDPLPRAGLPARGEGTAAPGGPAHHPSAVSGRSCATLLALIDEKEVILNRRETHPLAN